MSATEPAAAAAPHARRAAGKRANMDCYQLGDHAEFSKTVTDFDVYGFAGIVGDFYGVHVDEEFAKKTRFGRRIAQGALSVGFLATVMGHMASFFWMSSGFGSPIIESLIRLWRARISAC